eukprot:5045130-Pleurochrysis_carterae.AAC.3
MVVLVVMAMPPVLVLVMQRGCRDSVSILAAYVSTPEWRKSGIPVFWVSEVADEFSRTMLTTKI